MRIVQPSAKVISMDLNDRHAITQMLKDIEEYGRICYQSSHKITDTSYLKFLIMIISKGHESVLEHKSLSVRFIVDRGVSHELVRHRIASFSQESTRYCNYGKNDSIDFIVPDEINRDEAAYQAWVDSIRVSELAYFDLLSRGQRPEIARSILPNALKTELVMTANLREWRHFFKLRTSPAAHPQMRQVAIPLLNDVQEAIPIIFDGI